MDDLPTSVTIAFGVLGALAAAITFIKHMRDELKRPIDAPAPFQQKEAHAIAIIAGVSEQTAKELAEALRLMCMVHERLIHALTANTEALRDRD